MNDKVDTDPRLYAIPDIHGHAKGEHKAFSDERPIPLSARMLFLWFYHACRRGWPRFLMVSDHMNYLTFEDPAAINLVRRALKLAQAGDLYGAAETASVDVGHAAVVSEGLRRGMRYSIGAEVDNDPRSRPDAQNIVDAMKPDGMIRSVHFLTIDHPTHGPNWNWPFDNPEFADVHETVGTAKTWELYMSTVLDAVERLPGNILGHFYVPALFGNWPDEATLDTYENQIVDACEARGMAIEFNTRFLYRDHSDAEKAQYLNAHRRLLAKCKAKNVGIAVGSDAHSPKDQGRAFQTVLALLDECEINELVFPIAGRLARVALRVERKVEPLHEQVTPPVEERKLARKGRSGDAPDEDAAAATPAPDEPAIAVKAKPRPKRAKVKSGTDALPAGADDETVPPQTASDNGLADGQPPAAVILTEAVVSEPVAGIVTEAAFEAIVDDRDSELAAAAHDAVVDEDTDSFRGREEETSAGIVEPEIADAGDGAEPEEQAAAPVDQERADVPKAQPSRARARTKASVSKAKAAPPKAEPAAKKPVKASAKPALKKASTKKTPAKKTPVVKVPAKKVAAKKAPAKKAAVRAPGAKKAAAKKASKKSTSKKPAQRRR